MSISWKPKTSEDMLFVIQSGVFCNIVKNDLYDQVWGKWLEWGYETEESYKEEKKLALKNGSFERYLLQNLKSLKNKYHY